jgi:hypothetical protein
MQETDPSLLMTLSRKGGFFLLFNVAAFPFQSRIYYTAVFDFGILAGENPFVSLMVFTHSIQ